MLEEAISSDLRLLLRLTIPKIHLKSLTIVYFESENKRFVIKMLLVHALFFCKQLMILHPSRMINVYLMEEKK